MRLTLRTLLAYLDDILEPADSHDLGVKIKESDYATGLVHRIRAAMGRMRLSCPRVMGKGLATDENSVAEYLDNTLAVERVPEFEKICLESDMNLAEVSSCHQVLTLVLGEPAEIPDRLRGRMYSLASPGSATDGHTSGDSIEQAPFARGGIRRRIDDAVRPAAGANDSARVERPSDVRRDQQIDEYYQRQRPKWLPIVFVLLLGFIVTTAFLLMMNGWNRQPVADQSDPASGGLNGGMNDTTETIDPQAPAPGIVAEETVPDWPGVDAPQPVVVGSDLPEVAPPITHAPPLTDELVDANPVQTPSFQPPSPDLNPPQPEQLTSVVPATLPPEATNAENRVTPPPLDPAESLLPAATGDRPIDPVMGRSDDVAGPSVADLATNENGLAATDGAGMESLLDSIESEAMDDRPDVTAVPLESEVPEDRTDVGRNLSEEHVLAYWDDSEEAWMRMPARSKIEVNQRLRGLPGFRPQIILNDGIQLTLDGDVDFGVLEPAADGTPRFSISGGQAVLTSVGQQAGQIGIQAGDREFVIRQGDVDAQAAIRIRQVISPGNQPETADRHFVVDVWVLSGSCSIVEPDEPERTIQVAEVWNAIDLRAASIRRSTETPMWAARAELREIDREAMGELQPLLSIDRSLTLSLLEANQSRHTDMRSVTARCLAALDRFDPIIEALGDRKQHPHWTQHYQQLQKAVHRDSRVSERLYETLQRTQGPDADRIYRMLWGFTPLQLKQSGGEMLVENLTDESLEVRVIAAETLKQITGMHLYYRAEQPEARRQNAVNNWKKRLSAGKLTHLNPPLMFDDAE